MTYEKSQDYQHHSYLSLCPHLFLNKWGLFFQPPLLLQKVVPAVCCGRFAVTAELCGIVMMLQDMAPTVLPVEEVVKGLRFKII